ncbi:MAG: prephenate dehydrogenase [Prolixibacteraceae bacterium]|nr:prephenate dehydrogenase [Prolixibacteraceae bacterium]
MKITIIGLGLIGGSLAKDLRKTKFATELTGVDINEANAAKAVELGLVDRTETLEKAISGSDIILIAIPVDKEFETLPYILDNIDNNTTVADMGSAKKIITDLVKDHPKRKQFIAAHPMSGTEDSGPAAALEGLFRGKIAIICDHEESGPQHLALIEKMLQSLEMDIAYMTSDEQDHSTAFVSHLPHAAAFALANAVLEKTDRNIIFDLASGGFRSTVRLAKSSCSMWKPIFEQNQQYMVDSLNVYIKHLQQFRDSIQLRQFDKLEELILNANKIRSILDGKNNHLIKNEEKIVKLYTKQQ